MDGDGSNELVHLGIGSALPATNNPFARIVAVDGKSGRERFRFETPVDWNFGDLSNDEEWWAARPRPILVRSENNKKSIATLLHHRDRSVSVVVLDHAGQKVGEIPVAPANSTGQHLQRVWGCDADGDGQDEIVLCRENEIVAVGLSQPDQSLWGRTLSAATDRVLRVASDQESPSSPTILLRSGDRGRSIAGVDAATGRMIWRCDGPQPQSNQAMAIDMLACGNGELPLVFFGYQNVSLSRSGHFVDGEAVSSDHGRGRRDANVAENDLVDPRFVRSFPRPMTSLDLARMIRLCGWLVFYCLTLWVAPIGFLASLFWRRQWGIRTLLVAPVVVSVVLMGMSMSGTAGTFRDLNTKLLMGLTAFPPLLASGLIAYWCFKRRWKKVAVWLALSVIIAVLMGIYLFLVVERMIRGERLPEERIAFDGILLIWLPAAVVTSWLLSVFVLLQILLRTIRRKRIQIA